MPQIALCAAWLSPEGCGTNAYLDPEWSCIERESRTFGPNGNQAACQVKLPRRTRFDVCFSFPDSTLGRELTRPGDEQWTGLRIEIKIDSHKRPWTRPLVWKMHWLRNGSVKCFSRYRHPLWMPANVKQIGLKLFPITDSDEVDSVIPYASFEWDVWEGTRHVSSYVHKDLPHGLELDDYTRSGTPAHMYRPGGVRRPIPVAPDKTSFVRKNEFWRKPRARPVDDRPTNDDERGKRSKRDRDATKDKRSSDGEERGLKKLQRMGEPESVAPPEPAVPTSAMTAGQIRRQRLGELEKLLEQLHPYADLVDESVADLHARRIQEQIAGPSTFCPTASRSSGGISAYRSTRVEDPRLTGGVNQGSRITHDLLLPGQADPACAASGLGQGQPLRPPMESKYELPACNTFSPPEQRQQPQRHQAPPLSDKVAHGSEKAQLMEQIDRQLGTVEQKAPRSDRMKVEEGWTPQTGSSRVDGIAKTVEAGQQATARNTAVSSTATTEAKPPADLPRSNASGSSSIPKPSTVEVERKAVNVAKEPSTVAPPVAVTTPSIAPVAAEKPPCAAPSAPTTAAIEGLAPCESSTDQPTSTSSVASGPKSRAHHRPSPLSNLDPAALIAALERLRTLETELERGDPGGADYGEISVKQEGREEDEDEEDELVDER